MEKYMKRAIELAEKAAARFTGNSPPRKRAISGPFPASVASITEP